MANLNAAQKPAALQANQSRPQLPNRNSLQLGLLMVVLASINVTACASAVRSVVDTQSDADIREFLDAGGPERVCKVILTPGNYGARTIAVARQAVKDEGIVDCNNPHRSAPIAVAAQPQPAAAPVTPPAPTPLPPAKQVESGSPESDQFAKHIQAYLKAKDCNANAYTLTKFDLELLSLKAQGDFEVEKQVADITLDFGDVAAEKGCIKQAREIYTGIVSTFIGIGYSAYRERARIGLDNIRGK